MAKKDSKSKTHKSFRRSYKGDYKRNIEIPGVGAQVVESFKMIFVNWKVFLPLLLVASFVSILTVGTEGILDETTEVFGTVVFLIIWLTTIFLLRHIMAGNEVGMRDGLYNAMTPLVSTFVVFTVAVVQSIPIMLLVIAYSAAIQTGFLTLPFYALLFFTFALVMVVLSGYLLSSTLIALIAVTVPGMYPMTALSMAADLMMGGRMKFILRLIALLFVITVMWGVLVVPFVMLKAPDLLVSIVTTIVACFTTIYLTTYLYIYYRYLIDDK